MDIKFKFETKDFNFKFLMFYLKINQKVEEIVLPITLLDMCSLKAFESSDNIKKYSLKGSLIKSQTFPILLK